MLKIGSAKRWFEEEKTAKMRYKICPYNANSVDLYDNEDRLIWCSDGSVDSRMILAKKLEDKVAYLKCLSIQ